LYRFVNCKRANSNFIFLEKAASNKDSGISQTISSMNETNERLQERGEKLSKLQERTAALDSAASDFSKLARQLNEQNKNRWF
jgi:methyl-accepting chemotaxis protein